MSALPLSTLRITPAAAFYYSKLQLAASAKTFRAVHTLKLPSVNCRRNLTNISIKPVETSNQVSPAQERYDLFVSVVLERKPIITKEKTPLEKKYTAFLAEYEMESSKKSDHEIRVQNDKIMLEKIKTGEIDSGTMQTAQDFEDKSNAELLEFTPMSRKTEADEKNDMKSLDRALESHLVLVVEQKLGNGFRWICPQLRVEAEQPLRKVAGQVLNEVCPGVKATIMGSAPWGFYRYRYPPGTRNESGVEITGAKIFFYKANYVSGTVITSSSKSVEVNDYLWLKRSELKAKLNKKYHRKMAQFLVPEDESNA